MINETYHPDKESTKKLDTTWWLRILAEILVAFLPILILGTIGTIVGGGTFLGGAIIHSGYLLSILVAWFVLRLHSTGWREVGLARPKSWLRTAFLGFGTALIVIALILVISNITLNLPGLEQAEPDISRFNPLQGNLPLLLFSIFLAWTAVAFGEEMMYRAFLINQLGELFQGKKLRKVLPLLLSAVIFGLVHFYQGPIGIITTGLTGLILGVIYLWSGRNLWIAIIAHGLVNTLSFVLIYLGVT